MAQQWNNQDQKKNLNTEKQTDRAMPSRTGQPHEQSNDFGKKDAATIEKDRQRQADQSKVGKDNTFDPSRR